MTLATTSAEFGPLANSNHHHVARVGDPQAPWIEAAYSGKRIVTTKPGEHIRFKGKMEKVAAVSIYRALPLPEGTP